jgi:cell division protein FtsW (lipid II flippase)
MRLFLMFVVLAALSAPASAAMVESHEQRLTRLEQRVNHMDSLVGASVLCAALCALWAQNTGRNPWLWFFLGLIFSVIAVLVMLYKNAEDIKARKRMSRPPNS